jgi:hypothetical protein
VAGVETGRDTENETPAETDNETSASAGSGSAGGRSPRAAPAHDTEVETMRFFPDSLGRAEDLALGQGVIVAARWVLVAAGLVLALVDPTSASVLRTQVLLILALAVCNFALHAQLLRRRPTLAAIAYGASAADIAIVTALVVADGGHASGLYVFYFPAVLALSVAFPVAVTAAYVCVALAAMLAATLPTMPAGGEQDVLLRCLMLVAMALCGAVYADIEARRRRRALEEGARHAAAG